MRVLPTLLAVAALVPLASATHVAPISGSGNLTCSVMVRVVVALTDCNSIQQTHTFPAAAGTYRLTVDWVVTNPGFAQLQVQLLVVRCAGSPVCVGGGSASGVLTPGQSLTASSTVAADTAIVTITASPPGLAVLYLPTAPQPVGWTLSHL